MFFAQPETLKIRPQPPEQKPTQPVELTRTTSSRQKVQQETSKLVRWLKRGFLDPLKIILYLRFPAVAITVYYASITVSTYLCFALLSQQRLQHGYRLTDADSEIYPVRLSVSVEYQFRNYVCEAAI